MLPSSILSNDSGSYTGAREILLKNFLIRSIVQFGSKTFGATGTNTVVLFLEKYNEPPKQSSLKYDSANAIIHSAETDDWEDGEILRSYLQKIQVTNEDYRKFTEESVSFDGFTHCEYLKMYTDEFQRLTKTVNLQNSNAFKRLLKDEQDEKLKQEFYSYAKPIEFEKLLYFALTYKQTTLIVSAPTDNTEQKRFLGYDWSNRKGAEGIQITQAGGMLYNDTDRNATSTIASAIRCRFNETTPPDLGEKQQYCTLANLSDMIDFSRITFNKAIKLTPDKKIEIRSKYPLVKLENVASVDYGTRITKKEAIGDLYPVYGGGGETFRHNEFNRENCYIISRFGMSPECVRYVVGKFFLNDSGLTILSKKTDLSDEYLNIFFYVYQNQIYNLGRGSAQKNLDMEAFRNLRFPLPPLDIQSQIVSECEKIDEEYNTSRMSIEEYKKKISQVFENLEVIVKTGGVTYRLSNSCVFNVSIGRRVLNSEVSDNYNIPVYSANVFEPFGMIDKLLIQDFSMPSILWGIDGDWMVNTIEANQPFYPTDHCGVLRIKSDDILPKYMAWLLEKEGKRVGFSRTYRASIDRIESLTVQVAPIEEQRKAIEKVEAYEVAIAEAKTVMAGCADRKKAVLERYLW